MGKNIVIFSDGTCQKGGVGGNTNVYKLFNMIEDRTERQIAYYDPGLGTNWRKITGALFGGGILKNILDCYRFIFENFEASDKIYLFGFSRGAATVRSLSAFIHLFGILPKSRPDLIKQAFAIYKKSNRNIKARAFIEKHHTMWCSIEFVGVWDTVAALGFPVKSLSVVFDKLFPHKFHSLELCEGVKFARHALSIDEERKTFKPELWNSIGDQQNDRMKQVWFSGGHTDIGGGYKEEDLSNITLKWMMREAEDKKLLIYDKSDSYKMLMTSSPNINGIIHNEQKGFPGKFFKKEQRSWSKETHNEPCVHESVTQRIKNNGKSGTSEYLPWILDEKNNYKPSIEPASESSMSLN